MPDVLAVLSRPAAGQGTGTLTRVPADAPLVRALDLGVTRGDGVFETISVAGGRAQALDAHLARLARSAAMLELPEPELAAWRSAVLSVAADLAALPEAFVKLVYTRGVEGTDVPTGWVLGQASPDHTRSRTVGISVAVLDRGYRHDVVSTAPWLLQGAKTLSYAVNRAAVREAKRRGADDALFVSSDGFLLEGPTANLLLRRGDRLITPATNLGILAGTTQSDAFRYARSQGLTTSYELLPVGALDDADGLWLVSSVRHAAPIRAVDGVERGIDANLTRGLNDFLVARRD